MLDDYVETSEDGTVTIRLPLDRDLVNRWLGRCRTQEEYEAADKDLASPPMTDVEWERFSAGVDWPALVGEMLYSLDSFYALERAFERLTKIYVVRGYRVRAPKPERVRSFATAEEAQAYLDEQQSKTDEFEWRVHER